MENKKNIDPFGGYVKSDLINADDLAGSPVDFKHAFHGIGWTELNIDSDMEQCRKDIFSVFGVKECVNPNGGFIYNNIRNNQIKAIQRHLEGKGLCINVRHETEIGEAEHDAANNTYTIRATTTITTHVKKKEG